MTAPQPARSGRWPWIARIVAGDRVIGSAFSVGDGLVVTAAHVLTGIDRMVERSIMRLPRDVTVRFPLSSSTEEWHADLVAFVGPGPGQDDDVAVLRLHGDPSDSLGTPPPLLDEPVEGHRCRIYGFPQGFQNGVWATGSVVGENADGLWQIAADGVRAGFSGSPVWDDDDGGVVGMLVAHARDENVSFMLPTATFAKLVGEARAAAVSSDAAAPPREQRATASEETAANDQIRWLTDFPATDDSLKRIPLARALMSRLREIQSDGAGRSFLIHLDGEWGAGKSSLLNFIRDEAADWLVVDVNAWRQSRMGPPWWSLLTSLRTALRRSLGVRARLSLRVTEALVRARRGGGVYPVALVGFVLLGLLLYLAFRPAAFDVKTAADLFKAVAGGLAAIATLWGAAMLASRFLLWDSPRGARFYETSDANPAQSIADHFAWLIHRGDRPVLFLVDDLDRAPAEYVVELIETVQTLIRDAPHDHDRPRSTRLGCHFVIAADGAWIRQSFETRYEAFTTSIAEPGRPLGHLFLDKIFQLTVAVPAISGAGRSDYLRDLLGVGDRLQPAELDAERAVLEERIRRSTSEREIIDALRAATPVVREVTTPQAIDRLHSRAVETTREHFLQQYADLLAPNPRSMKRYVIANSMARTVLTLQGDFAPPEVLALWLIVQTRWPALAAYLRSDPDAAGLFAGPKRATEEQLARLPETLRPLCDDATVHRVMTFRPGGPLTPALIRDLTGHRSAPAPAAGRV